MLNTNRRERNGLTRRLRGKERLRVSQRWEIFLLRLIIVLLILKIVCILSLILLSGLYLAAITFLPEGEVKVMAVETDPVALPGGVGGFRRGMVMVLAVLKRSEKRVHGRFFFFLFEL